MPARPRSHPGGRRSADALRRVHVQVAGVVQGVGFRPFVCRNARKLGLAGSVRNTTGCIEVQAEGPSGQIQRLVDALRDGPPNARVDTVSVEESRPLGQRGFVVVPSDETADGEGTVSADTATCPRCLREMYDPQNRRYRYPFINCTNCGPRFTITGSLPYDRVRTSMAVFDMCSRCRDEYTAPLDRRYHAEATACPACGPKLVLLDSRGGIVARDGDAIESARARLLAGQIVAIKGLGGFHLACDATNNTSVTLLRRLKGRPDRPVAVMCRDLSTVRGYCHVSASEARTLTSTQRPILLLAQRKVIADGLAPISTSVTQPHGDLGVMLPYTPLHQLLLDPGKPSALVMTSGNRSDEPICIDEARVIEELGGIAEAFLVHDRGIVSRCDDSVGYVRGGRLVLLRRSRGFVPLPVTIRGDVEPTLALGATMSNTFALARGRKVYLSQHIGDVDNLKTLSSLREAIERFGRCIKLDPVIVAHDMHPDLLTTHLAGELSAGRRRVAVQHHHAHMASLMAAAGIESEVQALVLDGTGWGPDGTIWGCEHLVGTPGRVRRVGHLRALPLPGGEASIRRPLRLAIAYLHVLVPGSGARKLDIWKRATPDEVGLVHRLVDRGFNSPRTSSAGRLFDAVASLLGVRDDVTYEGQAAIELELLARRGKPPRRLEMGIDIVREMEGIILDPARLLEGLVTGLASGRRPADLAAGFHKALAGALVAACETVREDGGPDVVILGGGTFQNRILTHLVSRGLRSAGLTPVLPASVPAGDGGLALGQVLVANAGPDAWSADVGG